MTGVEAVAIGSLVVGAVGAATSVVGGISSANAASKQAAYAAQVAQNNATIAEQNRQAAIQTGHAQAEAQGLKERAQFASITAAQAASGIDVNSGSSADVRASQRELGLTDRATVEHNAFMQAYGYQSQETGYQAQAGLQTAASQNATALAPVAAAATGLEGASALGSKWNQFVLSGALPSKSTSYDERA